MKSRRELPDLESLARGIRAGERAVLARAITLIESKRADHLKAARALVQELLPGTGRAVRVGITGAPGVGKSTTIDALGTHLTGRHGHRVAVLAVDPLLGAHRRLDPRRQDPDGAARRRRQRLHPPLPVRRHRLGGVAAKTREMPCCCAEAAGFDAILVETVGIGQSETAVADMTDFFLALMLPGAGDELQGLKKGLVELADMIRDPTRRTATISRARPSRGGRSHHAALHILTPRSPNWTPPVMTYSGLTGDGVADLWAQVIAHRDKLTATGEVEARRRAQQQVEMDVGHA